MNWGKGIFIGMTLFIGFITILVVMLISRNVDLQSEDYYDREMNYELEISALRNGQELAEKIQLIEKSDFILVQIPPKGEYLNVRVDFLRPDDKKEDKVYNIKGTRSYLIPISELKKGSYLVEIRFQFNGKECMQNEEIYL